MSIADQIKRGMTLAFFASAYADLCEECDQALSGEIMEQLPEDIDPAALRAAETLALRMVPVNGFVGPIFDIASVYERVDGMDTEGADRELTPELFGHYCAMQAMGHGVGLESFGDAVYRVIKVPDVAFGSDYLEGEYFTRLEADD